MKERNPEGLLTIEDVLEDEGRLGRLRLDLEVLEQLLVDTELLLIEDLNLSPCGLEKADLRFVEGQSHKSKSG
jgi:hypothetical protein